MLLSALALLAGSCAFHSLASLPGTTGLLLVPLAALVFVRRRPARAAGFAAAGFLWTWWVAASVLAQCLPAGLEGRDLLVRGVVTGLPERLPGGRVRFRFHVEALRGTQGWQPLQLDSRIAWYRHPPALQPGERWQLSVRLKRPHGFSSPGAFDYQRWLFARRIRATGYVRPDPGNRKLGAEGGQAVQRLRQTLLQHLRDRGVEGATGALLRALAIGDRSAMSARQWQVLRRTGTGHLLAISGLHVGLVAGLVFLLGERLWRRFGLPQRYAAPRVAAVLAFVGAGGYALLAGFQVPAQRALIMSSVVLLAAACGRRSLAWRLWALALMLVLLVDPLSLLGAGTWLSFGAVAVLFFLSLGRHGASSRLRSLFTLQLGLVLGLAPWLWLWFRQLAPLAPVANLVAIPWVGFVVVPPLLLALVALPLSSLASKLLLSFSAGALQALWWLLEGLASFPAALWPLPSPAAGWILLFAGACACLLLPRAVPLRLAGVALLWPLFLLPPPRPASGDLWLDLLDVGEGLAAVVQTRRHCLVYDTGPAFRSGFETGSAVVAPFLQARGWRRVDRLVISHGDNDHIGGARALFRAVEVADIDSGEPEAIDWSHASRCRAGEGWSWDGVRFDYLAPLARVHGNNASCVLRVQTSDGQVLLLPGDIEAPVERRLVRQQAGRLAAQVLVVPHHGSLSSSTPAFLDAVRPAVALFPVGYRNRFGFPREEVLERYRSLGARLFDTATSGTIEVRLEAGAAPGVRGWRRRRPHYWESAGAFVFAVK